MHTSTWSGATAASTSAGLKADALADLERYIGEDGLDVAMDLPAIDAYFAGLSDDDMLLCVDGEDTEREAFMANAPAGASAFLDAVFDRP